MTPSSVLQGRWWWAGCVWTKLIPWDKILHSLLQGYPSPMLFFRNCSVMGLFPQAAILSGMDCPQHSHRQQLLPENLLLHSLPSEGCSSCQELQCGLAADCSFFQGVSTCCRVTGSSCLGGIAGFTMVCRETSPPVSGALLLPLFDWTWCLQICLPCVSSVLHSFLCISLYTFLNTLSPKCHWSCWWAQLWPVVGLFWGHLKRAVSNPRVTHGGHAYFIVDFAYMYMQKIQP